MEKSLQHCHLTGRDDPMSNDRIKEAMNLMFATILQRWGQY